MSRRIVITGGTGQVGGILRRHFENAGDHLIIIGRHAPSKQVLDGADVVINLAGRSVNCRYTPANRRLIKDSRVNATRAVGRAIEQAARPPGVWLNASTATIYRHALDRPMDEVTGEIGTGFSVDVALAWERALFDVPAPRTRKVALRSAMIMSPDRGGVFSVLLRMVRLGFGGAAGPGTQFVSWIHDEDFVRAVEFLIGHNEIDGAVNVCSPKPLPNRDFMRTLRTAYGVRVGLPAPKWMLEGGAFFLRSETELIVKSRRVVPEKLQNAGFNFVFPDWERAAKDLVARTGRPG